MRGATHKHGWVSQSSPLSCCTVFVLRDLRRLTGFDEETEKCFAHVFARYCSHISGLTILVEPEEDEMVMVAQCNVRTTLLIAVRGCLFSQDESISVRLQSRFPILLLKQVPPFLQYRS